MNHYTLRGILRCIRWYQKTISFDHGFLSFYYPYGFCRFYPSCSEYSYQSFAQNGLFLGVFQAIKRIVRCNPFSKGGIDLPRSFKV